MTHIRIENGKRALVLGCGTSGAAAARFLFRRGWDVCIADTTENPAGAVLFAGDEDKPELICSRFDPSLIDEKTSLLVLSPGLSPEHSAAAPLVEKARELGIDIAGEIELFARELKRLKRFRGYWPDVIGITGTNGKTTTTVLTSKMAAVTRATVVAGNIGPSALVELDKALEVNALPDVWVLELSSFQLQSSQSLECTAAAFLNLTQDHIDWHGSLEAYAEAKRRIFAESTVRVVNGDDEESAKSALAGIAQVFGDRDPAEPGEWGVTTTDGIEWLSFIARNPAPELKTGKRSTVFAETPEKTLLMPVDALKIQGRHNVMNALAALALIEAAGLSLAHALRVLRVYEGEAHRVQSILTTACGVEFIDDGKATNVGAVCAALEGLGRSGRKVSIILGGDGKGQDFSPLEKPLGDYACYAVLIGRDAPEIAEVVRRAGVPFEAAGTEFEAAVHAAYEHAEGGVVLLSPACASWDMFKNYEQRSARFADEARRIAGRESARSEP